MEFFRDLPDMVSEPAWRAYVNQRLRKVQARTVKKEVSAERRFLAWAKSEGYLLAIPVIEIDKSRTGKKAPHGSEVVELSEVQVEAILSQLPQQTKRGKHRAKAFYTVMWETGLRRGTLWRLRVEDVDLDSQSLRIRDEADKARFGRTLPLSQRAVEAFESAGRQVGLVFGKADLRTVLKAAAKAAGVPKWQRVSNHDFRHARLTKWGAETTDVLSVMHLAGHKQLGTTTQYMGDGYRAAEHLVRGTGIRTGRGSGHARRARPRRRSALPRNHPW